MHPDTATAPAEAPDDARTGELEPPAPTPIPPEPEAPADVPDGDPKPDEPPPAARKNPLTEYRTPALSGAEHARLWGAQIAIAVARERAAAAERVWNAEALAVLDAHGIRATHVVGQDPATGAFRFEPRPAERKG